MNSSVKRKVHLELITLEIDSIETQNIPIEFEVALKVKLNGHFNSTLEYLFILMHRCLYVNKYEVKSSLVVAC